MLPNAPTAPSPQVRGALLLGLKQWVVATHGAAGLAALVETLPLQERGTWESSFMVNTSQHPAQTFTHFADAITRQWGAGDPKFIRQVAASIAINDLATYMKILMKLGTPSFVSTRFPKIWSHYFSSGALTVSQRDTHSATLELTGWEPYGHASCFGTEGWASAAITYSGGKQVQCVHTPRANQVRSFELTWS